MKELDIVEILNLLPHRYPFVLIDRVLSYEAGVRLRALKNVSFNEAHFPGHFPNYPVMPGVLILESMAQAMAVLAFKTLEAQGIARTGNEIFYFAGIDHARFKKPVRPGDQLIIDVTLTKVKRDVLKAEAVAKVGEELACAAELMAAYKGN